MAKKKRWTKNEIKDMMGTAGGGVVIPVNKALKTKQKIPNFWYVEQLLRKTDKIAVGKCYCRTKMQNCNHTTDIKLIFRREQYFGCGLCIGQCPANAIKLVER